MNSDRLACALEEARRVEKQLIDRDRQKENEREEALTLRLAAQAKALVPA